MLRLLFLMLISFSLKAQINYEKTGESFASDIKIVLNHENFKLTDGDHKELLGLYLSGMVYKDLKNSGLLEAFGIGSFEIHVNADVADKINLADLRVSIINYLKVNTLAKGSTLQFELNVLEFDYRGTGLYEVSDKQISYLDFSIAKGKVGYRYNTANGSYIVLGAIAGLGMNGRPRGNLEAAGITQELLAPTADLNDSHTSQKMFVGQDLMFMGGGFIEINANEKFKLYGSAEWRSKGFVGSYRYRENLLSMVPSKDDPNILEEKITARDKEVAFYSQGVRFNLTLVSDLGKTVSKNLTGFSVFAAADIMARDFSSQRSNQWNANMTEEEIDLVNINQSQFRVGVILKPSQMIKRSKRAKAYRAFDY